MREISLTFDRPQIKINGIVFDVLRSDKAIVQDMCDIDLQFADKDLNDPHVVIEKNDVLLKYLDTLFGSGAMERIESSIPGIEKYGLGLSGLDDFLASIVQAAGNAYSHAIKLKYDD